MSETKRADDEPLLKRLLGPDGPELSCEECFEQLDRYVELELSGADADAGGARACARTSQGARPATRTTAACARWSRPSRHARAA